MSDIVPSFDYTSRDFLALRQDLLTLVADRFNAAAGPGGTTWNPSDPTDFGVVLVEAFAYVGDLLNYYLDRVANEAVITTAVQPDNVYALANLLGYQPSASFPATITIQFTSTLTGSTLIPAGTRYTYVLNGTRVIFETTAAVTVPGPGSVTVTAVQGYTVDDVASNLDLGTAVPGQISQTFLIPETPVIQGSVEVFLDNGGTVLPWTFVYSMSDSGPSDNVYTTYTNAAQQTFIQFGDGVFGAIPNGVVRAKYRVGGGKAGNLPVGLRLDSGGVIDPGIAAVVSVAGTGGADAESLDSIRYNAPRVFATMRRAVTPSDYEALARSVPGVEKAQCVADMWSTPAIFIGPTDDNTLTPGIQPGGTSTTAAFNALSETARIAVQQYAMAGFTVSIVPPFYSDIVLGVTLTVSPLYAQSVVQAAAHAKLLDLMTYKNTGFGADLVTSDFIVPLMAVPGVIGCDVPTLLRLTDGTSGIRAVTATAGELFILQEANLTLVVSGGI